MSLDECSPDIGALGDIADSLLDDLVDLETLDMNPCEAFDILDAESEDVSHAGQLDYDCDELSAVADALVNIAEDMSGSARARAGPIPTPNRLSGRGGYRHGVHGGARAQSRMGPSPPKIEYLESASNS